MTARSCTAESSEIRDFELSQSREYMLIDVYKLSAFRSSFNHISRPLIRKVEAQKEWERAQEGEKRMGCHMHDM
jgi:hypothetical protein